MRQWMRCSLFIFLISFNKKKDNGFESDPGASGVEGLWFIINDSDF